MILKLDPRSSRKIDPENIVFTKFGPEHILRFFAKLLLAWAWLRLSQDTKTTNRHFKKIRFLRSKDTF